MGKPATLEDVLAHYGVKGMKWGVRKDRNAGPGPASKATPVRVKATPGQKVKTKGGKGQPASEDAIRVASSKQRAKSSTTDALSNKELQDVVTRMNLEQQYKKLSSQQKTKSVGKQLFEKYRDREINSLMKGEDSPTVEAAKMIKYNLDRKKGRG